MRENFEYITENIATILELHPNPDVVTKLDFNFCYWIPCRELREFAKQCTNLKELAVAHSGVSNQDLAEILAENEQICKLSFSIETPETFWLEHASQNLSTTFDLDLWVEQLQNSHFGKCIRTLAKLESLEIYIGQNPVILGTVVRYNCHGYVKCRFTSNYTIPSVFYSACKCLQNLLIRLDLEETVQEDKYIVYSDSFSFPQLPLKSIVLDYGSTKNIDDCMVIFFNEIVQRSVLRLQCLWTPISYREKFYPIIAFNLTNMVTWVRLK